MKIKWLNTALVNLDSAATYLYERNPNSAEIFIREVKSLTEIQTVAKSMDDSFGESFDKVAKMMGLG